MTWARCGVVLREVFTYPLVAWFIRDRSVAIGFIAVGAVLSGANLIGVSLWQCPIFNLTGYECPGCGLSRGSVALCRGRIDEALAFHWFTPLFLLGASVIVTGVALPRRLREKFADLVEALEVRTGITAGTLFAAAIYGLTRNVWS